MHSHPLRSEGVIFGAEYNPEQWDLATQSQDIPLMVEAGITMVTLGTFAWGALETDDGVYDFKWLRRVMDRLHAAGISVCLATPTACPPMWLYHAHPEMAMTNRTGVRLGQGSRQNWCPSSPAYSRYALRLVGRLAEEFGDHPALAIWHVGNEMGCHNTFCFCERSAADFRQWLRERYGTIDRLNHAWGTAFWGQYFRDFDHIDPPRETTTLQNSAHRLDFARFSSDRQIALYDAERDILKSIAPDVPVTTNFMVTEHISSIDYGSFAEHVDLVANDHYLIADDAQSWRELAFCADRTRGLSDNRPWLLMEHSTSAVNWQPRNIAKTPGEMRRNTLAHIARGADGVMFFQWRQSAFGAEKYHSAVVPHAGTETRIWDEAVALGASVARLAEVRGTTADTAQVAIVFDYEAWWATQLDGHPTVDFSYSTEMRSIHSALLDRGIAVDVVPPKADLSKYSAVVVAGLYMMSQELADKIVDAVERGTHLLVTYFSGIVDSDDHVWLGGYPGALRETLGVRVEEFTPLRAGESVRMQVTDRHPGVAEDELTGSVWAERLRNTTAESLAVYSDPALDGAPAITVRDAVGPTGGSAWYISTHLAPPSLAAVVGEFCRVARIRPAARVRGSHVEVIRRRGDDRSYLFAINHSPKEAFVDAAGTDLLTGEAFTGRIPLRPGDVRVIREATA
ncbi:beta-galactosidase [Microbacterium sp.]|uniref:beta-galactosidase n=1 Tax=Microbacterium sp. TaxID=51671 RepID=UPI0028124712|nr:beta-galactosidase [Microbacterium sp.]